MSHSHGEAWSLDGKLLGYFEYNGTVDVVCSPVYPTPEEVNENWRGDNSGICRCGATGSLVILWTSYGNGFCWLAKWCPECRCITEGRDSYGSIDGHPFLKAEALAQ